MRRVARAGGLSPCRRLGPTWLDRSLPDFLRRFAGLPIDQVFAKGDVEIASAHALEAIGSDHLPVLVSSRWRRRAAAGQPVSPEPPWLR